MSAARAAFGAGARAALSMPAWIVASSMLGVGSLARDAGHPLGAALLSTVLIWAAPAQLIFYGALVSNALLLATALAIGLSALRLLPMVISIWPLVHRPGQPVIVQMGLAHLVAATTWIESLRRLPAVDPAFRQPFYLGFALSCLGLSVVMTALGFLLVEALPRPLAAGLLCLTPIYFGVSLIGSARGRGDLLAIGLGVGLLPVARWIVGADFDLLATGLVGGTAAWFAGRLSPRFRA